VTIVFLVFNRREELRTSLRRMLGDSDYDAGRVDVVVVDNASEDGSADMVRDEFPGVRLIVREANCGVSGFNDGFALARGDYVLALDDDCYLPPDGLRRAVEAAEEHAADLVSFGVISAQSPEHRFDRHFRMGLLGFWGCAVLFRREVLAELTGYDPQIFVWANEPEFMLRFFDRGFRHLYLPEVVAVHMKEPEGDRASYVRSRNYLMNSRHFAYIVGKHLRARDAAGALVALLSLNVRETLRADHRGWRGIPETLRGFRRGVRHRTPVRPEVSRVYRRDFHAFANPFSMARPVRELAVALPAEWLRARRGLPEPVADKGRFAEYVSERARYYPTSAATLQL
jgi:GT2 family glycosyltransferase